MPESAFNIDLKLYEKETQAVVFSCEFCGILRIPILKNISQVIFLWNKAVKKYIHANISYKYTGDGVLFSAVAGMRAYSFTKKGLHHILFSEIC